jgi:class 3 adenylate cyclase/tetratricopeptide (TPR) repeat protein
LTTENVAILFTDVVGSTELSQRLSPESADEVRRGHFSVLRQAIAEAGGTEVKNLGDGLMVAFASASAALACGVAMQQGVERDNRGREHSVGVRVGLSGGEVSREDGDYFGDPVVEAARLCAKCESGQILAADVVRAMAGRRSRQECRSVGELQLKGLPDPVEAVEVVWEPLGGAEISAALSLPGRLVVRPAVGVVGRDPEVQAIGDAAKRVTAGEGREVLLISGEAGLGKTTLVAEASRAAFDNGAVVLFGHCEEDLATPYQLFAEALGHYVTYAPEDQLMAHVAAHGSELARLVPALSSRIPDLPSSKATDADTERFLLFAAVVGLLSQVSQEQLAVVVLDDLQWADKASLLLLRHIATSDQVTRVLVIGTYRDTELSQGHPLLDALAAMRRLDGVSRIDLAGLDDIGVVAFLEAAAGQTLDDDGVGLAHAVYRETDGNPFFVSEVLRNLVETGALYQDSSGRWVSDFSLDEVTLPDSVREVIGARVGRLGPEAGKVLSMAAVIGRDFDLDVLAQATETSEDELLDTLEAAAAVALVRELAGRYSFSHALIQHTLSEDLGPNRRARAHRKVAEALEGLCGDRPGVRVGELARHWLSATQPIDISKAMGYARQAGDAALAALAPADALAYYAQALDLYPQANDPDPVLALDLAIGLGTAQRQTGDPAFRETLLDAARRAADLGDTERLVAAALANNRGYFSAAGVIDNERVEVLEMALDRLPADQPDRALVLATLCSELALGSPLERRQSLADEALAIAESSGEDASILRVLNAVLYPLLVPSLLEHALTLSADALIRAERVGDPTLHFHAYLLRIDVAAQNGDIDEVDRCLLTLGSLTEQLDQPFFSWTHAWFRATRAQIAGDCDRAEQLATEALQIGNDSGQPDATFMFGSQLVVVSHQRGTQGELVPVLEQMVADAPDLAGVLSAALALAYAEADRIEEASQLLEDFTAAGFDLPFDPVWLLTMADWADVAIVCRHRECASPLLDRLAPWDSQLCLAPVAFEGPVSLYLGGLATVLGRYDEADVYFAQSSAYSSRVGAKFIAARTDHLWGTMFAERQAPGDIEKARDHLTKAHAVAATNGYGNIERRAADALRLLGR